MMAAAGQAILHATVAALVVEALRAVARGRSRRAPVDALGGHRGALSCSRRATSSSPRGGPASWFVERLVPVRGRALESRPRRRRRAWRRPPAWRSSILGTALYLRDAVPVRRRPRRADVAGGRTPPQPPCLRARPRGPRRVAWPRPRDRPSTVTVVDARVAGPAVHGRSIARRLSISTGTLDRLDDGALERRPRPRDRAPRDARSVDGLVADDRAHAPVLQPRRPDRGAAGHPGPRTPRRHRRHGAGTGARTGRRRAPAVARRRTCTPTWRCPPTAATRATACSRRLIAAPSTRGASCCSRARSRRHQPYRAWRIGLTGAALAALLFLVV